MLSALASGLLLGLSCGLAPGPLLALVLSQALRHGPREGLKVALAPLLTDAPIIIAALVLASRAAEIRGVLGGLSIAGSAFVLYLALDALRAPPLDAGADDGRAFRDARPGAGPAPRPEPSGGSDAPSREGAPPRSWLKGVLTNLLSPHPWLFWLTIGAATLGRAVADGWLAPVAFLSSFYLLLVGSKVTLAVIAGRSRGFLGGRSYRIVLGSVGLLLVGFAAVLFRSGLRDLGWLPGAP